MEMPEDKADLIYFGGNIYTMEGRDKNRVQAVAVKQDRIVFVGSKDKALDYKDNNTELFDLTNKTMLPGFIDPHIHHAFAGAFYFLTSVRADEDWNLPGVAHTSPVFNRQGYLSKLKEADVSLKDPDEWLIVYGYASYFHGKITKSDLEDISSARPIALFQRSGHEVFLNSKGLEELKFTKENTSGDPQIDFEQGRFVEAAALEKIFPAILPIILRGDNWQKALKHSLKYLHENGVTTVADMLAIDGFNSEQQRYFEEIIDARDVPLRTYMVAEPRIAYEKGGAEAAINFIDSLEKRSGNNLFYLKHVKMFVDGAFFAQLMRIKGGYTDGHQGEWITPVETLAGISKTFWSKGYPMHVHVNGDEGLDAILEIFEKLKSSFPKAGPRVTFHHLGYSRKDQLERIKSLNFCVSLLPYYLHALGDVYSKHGFPPENAQRISAAGSLIKKDIKISLHSDFPMAPSNPLYSAWCAVNRIGVLSGSQLAPEEKITVKQALRAITIGAAYTIGLENEIGSIKVGKKADFTILAENPFSVAPLNLKDIPIVGKVFNGKYFSLKE